MECEEAEMIKIFDTHAHYDDEAFDTDREQLAGNLEAGGVLAVTNIGANLETSRRTVCLTQRYDFFYGAVGVHPSDTNELEGTDGMAELKEMAENNRKIVAIGEIGLDYHYEDTDREVQQRWFIRQMELARELSLPIVVHSRDAARDTVDIMSREKAGEIGGVVHCYSYSREVAGEFLDMDFYFGIGGVLTFKNAKKLREVVEYVPIERLVLETDAPYLAPEPFRGKRNSSLFIPYVAKAIADIKGITEDEVYRITWNNALKLYRINM